MSTIRHKSLAALERQLRKRFPDASITSDLSKKKSEGYLDIEHDGYYVIVHWRAPSEFGISCAPGHSYGERADEVYTGEEAAYGRIVSLLLSRTYTSPPEAVRMAELRRERGMSQEDLAAALDVRQAAVSKLERRKDVLVSSVREVVRSMGGELLIVARFPDGMERTLEFDDEPLSPGGSIGTTSSFHNAMTPIILDVPAPYGYQEGGPGEKPLEIDEHEAEIVCTIFERYGQTGTTQDVAEWLNSQEIPNKEGKKWDSGAIGKLLGNLVYVGRLGKGAPAAVGWHEPIVGHDLSERIRAVRRRKSRRRADRKGD